MKVAVVTPTIGAESLAQCLESVQKQTYEDLTHYVFLDGKEHYEKIHPILYDKCGNKTIKTVELEENVGKGWYGHRVYAACSFLVNADIICYLDEDNCESLGKWPVYFNDEVFHVDTSSFAIKRDIGVRIGHAWYGQWGADRQFFTNLKKHFPKFNCSNSHTLCYRLDGNPNSVTQEFFEEGNRIQTQKYGEHFPWKNKGLHQIEIGPNISLIL